MIFSEGNKMRKKKRNSVPKLQLTALVDAFTILIVFFIFQHSTEPENIKSKDRINLPKSEYGYATKDLKNMNVLISDKFIKVNESEVLQLRAGELSPNTLHSVDSEFISSLHDILSKDESFNEAKDHQWVILADEKVPYDTVKKTIYTLAVSGFTKIKLASTVEFK